jgi:hypothetical protein
MKNIEQSRDRQIRVDDFSITLTDDWFSIPMRDEEKRKSVIVEYFDTLFVKFESGGTQPPIKKELKKILTEQVDRAEKVGAVFMAFFSLIIEEVPIDAVLTIYKIGMKLPIDDIYNNYKAKNTNTALIKGEKHSVARRSNLDDVQVLGDIEIKQARIEYWLNASPSDTGYYFVFTSTYLEIIDVLTEMFDMIAISALEEFQD